MGLLDRFLRSWRPELGTSGTGRVRRCPTCAEERPADAFTKQAAALDNFNRTIAQQWRVKSAVWAEHVRYWSAKRAVSRLLLAAITLASSPHAKEHT